jgi:hypothetical protein
VLDLSRPRSSEGNPKHLEMAHKFFTKLQEQENSTSRRPKVQADTKIDLTNFLDLQFTGPVIIGSQQERLDVIYDTGSDWLAVDTDACKYCYQPVFNASQSTTFTNVTSSEASWLSYGSAYLEGFNATDNVYLKYTDLGVTNFKFFGITYQEGIDDTFDGIIGFSRQDSGEFPNGPLFVEEAKKAGALTKEQVSFYMDTPSGTNYAEFGAYSLSAVKGSSESSITWLNMPAEGFFWYSSAV